MGDIPIHRQKPPADKVDSSNGKAKETSATDVDVISAFETHIYLFPGFPAIILHVHPRFVLYNAGSKVFDNSPAIDDIEAAPRLERIAEKISEIHEFWTARRAPQEFYAVGPNAS